MHRCNATVSRFYSLDALRGLAALTVICWHWQHFFAPLNPLGVSLEQARQPFFTAFSFFYRHGFTAVYLFFCLSGFVFFWMYSQPIAQNRITFQRFSLFRLSRLYPLHIVTLVAVAVGQLTHYAVTQHAFVYQSNDAYHFLLNLLFISAWGLEKGYAFNAPIWSVSVEIFLYGVFFLYCRYIRPGWFGVIAIVVCGFALQRLVSQPGLGMIYFFLGGLCYLTYSALLANVARWRLHWLIPAATVGGWSGAVMAVASGRLQPWPFLRPAFGEDLFSAMSLLLFPLTVLSLVTIETRRGSLGRRLALLGEISYSSYLLHFPLQLTMAIVIAKLAITPDIYYSRAFFVLFFAILIPLSIASHKFFELPVQHWLRQRRSRVQAV